jgi:hypothetical protein
MSIDQPKVIDFIVHDTKNRRAVLIISDQLDWEHDERRHLRLLQDKLNHYIWFMESGKLVETMPDLKGLDVVIFVWGKQSLSKKAEKYYQLARQRATELGFALEFGLDGKLFESETS